LQREDLLKNDNREKAKEIIRLNRKIDTAGRNFEKTEKLLVIHKEESAKEIARLETLNKEFQRKLKVAEVQRDEMKETMEKEFAKKLKEKQKEIDMWKKRALLWESGSADSRKLKDDIVCLKKDVVYWKERALGAERKLDNLNDKMAENLKDYERSRTESNELLLDLRAKYEDSQKTVSILDKEVPVQDYARSSFNRAFKDGLETRKRKIDDEFENLRKPFSSSDRFDLALLASEFSSLDYVGKSFEEIYEMLRNLTETPRSRLHCLRILGVDVDKRKKRKLQAPLQFSEVMAHC